MTLQIGDSPIVVVRDSDGEIRAYHNACAHRGHRICTEERGMQRAWSAPTTAGLTITKAD